METYISERVLGLEQMEAKIMSAYMTSESLVRLIEEKAQPMDQIGRVAKQMNEQLKALSEFELAIVQRKIIREA